MPAFPTVCAPTIDRPAGASISHADRLPAVVFPCAITSRPLPSWPAGHCAGVLMPGVVLETATPTVPRPELVAGVQLPHTWIQMIPAAAAAATSFRVPTIAAIEAIAACVRWAFIAACPPFPY